VDIETKLQVAKAKRKELVEQVNEIASEIERLREQRQAILQEALRYDGEVRALEALAKEGGEKE